MRLAHFLNAFLARFNTVHVAPYRNTSCVRSFLGNVDHGIVVVEQPVITERSANQR
jgi:hypothetical protein